jgi:DNA-binding transcriptional LysR family regulator
MSTFRDVDVRHLEALVGVAEEGTFGRAATRLGFTQSAVSQQIASLERLLGVQLFDRPKGPRRVELTPAGELVLDHARAVLGRLSLAAHELEQLHRGERGRLLVGTFQSVSANLLPHVAGRLRHQRPELEIRLHEADCTDALVRHLLDDELDLVFLIDDGALDPRLDATFLAVDPYVLLVRAGEGPAGGRELLDALEGAPLVGQPEDNICQALVERALAAHGVTPTWVFRSIDNGAVQAMVRSGVGRAILPHLAVATEDPGVDLVDLDPAIPPRRIVLARRAGRTLHPAADAFVRIAQEVAATRAGPVAASPG